MADRRGLTRRKFLAASGAAGALACSATLQSGAGAAAPPAAGVAGWQIYTFDAGRTELVQVIDRYRPGVIRWFVEWDRIQTQRAGGPWVPVAPNWDGYVPFMRACARNGVQLIIQFHVMGGLWEGAGITFPGQAPGAQWAKPELRRNYPLEVDPYFGGFARSLRDALRANGVTANYGAFNEADHRYVLDGVIASKVPNHVTPWAISVLDNAKWSGGAGSIWRAMHDVMPAESWNSSMVTDDTWIAPTAAISQVELIAMSRYWGSETKSNQTVDRVLSHVTRWDALVPGQRRRVLVAESASSDTTPVFDTRECARLWQRHRLLREANQLSGHPLFGRYVGMTCHEPLPWHDLNSPAWQWWVERPQYQQFLDPEDPLVPPPEPPPAQVDPWTQFWRDFDRWMRSLFGLP